MIRLESVCEENFNQVIDLKRGTDVADFVDEPIYSLAEAFCTRSRASVLQYVKEIRSSVLFRFISARRIVRL